MDTPTPATHVEQTAAIVTAFVGHNVIAVGDLGNLISTVHGALVGLGNGTAPVAETVRPMPAVSVRKSISPEFLVCLEDGKKLKMLKRHLKSTYDLSPDQYRAKWGLPNDYPMVAPNYARQRSTLAKELGLGRRDADGRPVAGRRAAEAAPPAPAARQRRARAAKTGDQASA